MPHSVASDSVYTICPLYSNILDTSKDNKSDFFWDEYGEELRCPNSINTGRRVLVAPICSNRGETIFFFFFFLFGFYGPFKNISLISSRSFIEGGRSPENPEKNHLTIRKQNLAFPHMTRARLEPQR